jgi:two-component system CheB/CheR fusion protein
MSERSPKTIVIENHEDTLTYLCRYLEQKGHSVTGFRDMTSALAFLKTTPVEILISDIGLPDGDGWELLQQVAQLQPLPLSIAMSGYGSPADLERSREVGYTHHLIKPFIPQDLDALLDLSRN